MPNSFAMNGESPRIPHLAKPGSELYDLRDDVDDAFERAEVATVKVSMTAAEVKALAATPKELVAAPGADLILELIGLTLRLVAGSEVLAEAGDNLTVKYKDGSGVAATGAIEMTGFIDQAANINITALPIVALTTDAQGVNQALVLHNIGSEFTGNASDDAVLEAYVSYKRHNLA